MNTFHAMRMPGRKKQAAKGKKVHAYTGTVSIRLSRKDHAPIARAAAAQNKAISTYMREAAAAWAAHCNQGAL